MDQLNDALTALQYYVQLHERLEVWYVVSGWRAEFYDGDKMPGDRVTASADGATMEEAMVNLVDKLREMNWRQ